METDRLAQILFTQILPPRSQRYPELYQILSETTYRTSEHTPLKLATILGLAVGQLGQDCRNGQAGMGCSTTTVSQIVGSLGWLATRVDEILRAEDREGARIAPPSPLPSPSPRSHKKRLSLWPSSNHNEELELVNAIAAQLEQEERESEHPAQTIERVLTSYSTRRLVRAGFVATVGASHEGTIQTSIQDSISPFTFLFLILWYSSEHNMEAGSLEELAECVSQNVALMYVELERLEADEKELVFPVSPVSPNPSIGLFVPGSNDSQATRSVGSFCQTTHTHIHRELLALFLNPTIRAGFGGLGVFVATLVRQADDLKLETDLHIEDRLSSFTHAGWTCWVAEMKRLNDKLYDIDLEGQTQRW